MKALKLYILTVLVFSFTTIADDIYRPPKIKLTTHPVPDGEIVRPEIDSKNKYIIQENPYSDRALASEEEEGRGPSSKNINAPKKELIRPEAWKFDPRD